MLRYKMLLFFNAFYFFYSDQLLKEHSDIKAELLRSVCSKLKIIFGGVRMPGISFSDNNSSCSDCIFSEGGNERVGPAAQL